MKNPDSSFPIIDLPIYNEKGEKGNNNNWGTSCQIRRLWIENGLFSSYWTDKQASINVIERTGNSV